MLLVESTLTRRQVRQESPSENASSAADLTQRQKGCPYSAIGDGRYPPHDQGKVSISPTHRALRRFE